MQKSKIYVFVVVWKQFAQKLFVHKKVRFFKVLNLNVVIGLKTPALVELMHVLVVQNTTIHHICELCCYTLTL